MTPPPPESPTKKTSAGDGGQSKSEKQETAAAASRENFLRRLESHQQHQLKSPPEENTNAPNDAEKAPATKAASNDKVVTTKPAVNPTPAVKNQEGTKPPAEKVTTHNKESTTNDTDGNKAKAAVSRPTSQKKLSVGDELLLNYLSDYCELPGNKGTSESPCDWIQDVDASSLDFLKGLANVKQDSQYVGSTDSTFGICGANNHPNVVTRGQFKSDGSSNPPSRSASDNPTSRPNSNPPSQSSSSTNISKKNTAKQNTKDSREDKGSIFEIVVPSNVKPGQPFPLLAGGVKVMVTCPKNANPGQRIRFHLPPEVMKPPLPPPPVEKKMQPPVQENNWSSEMKRAGEMNEQEMMRTDLARFLEGKKNFDAMNSNWTALNPSPSTKPLSNSGDNDIQHRMLSIIENQQVQMFEMRARLDALGSIMIQMEKDVRYLRFQEESQGPPWQVQQGMGPGAPWQQQQGVPGQQQPPQEMKEVLPEAELKIAENLPEASFVVPRPQGQQAGRQRRPQNQRAQPRPVPNPLAPRHEQVMLFPQNQGIFFPLFLMLFRFLVSLPGRLRTVLLTTGVGRIYEHLRERAIERRAFAHVDLASIMKLVVMLVIFSGRVGDNGGNGGGAARNNRRRNGEEEEFGIMAHAYSLLQSVIDYWNGHRVHTLVLASFIGFLIQVGLLKFLYQVLWVEREDLLRVWLGHGMEEDDDLAGEDGHEANHGWDALQRGDPNGANDVNAPEGQVGRDQNPGGVAHPAAPMGGMIRRGPNNGGFFHDIQCLILSFLLSLIPAWRPEEAAQEVEPQQQQVEAADQDGPDLGEQPAAAPVQEGGGDDGADDGNDAAE